MAWRSTIPSGDEPVDLSTVQIRANWAGWDACLSGSHFGMSVANSGMHLPGHVEAFGYGTSATMQAMSSVAGTGSIWWDTSSGTMKVIRSNGTNPEWQVATSGSWSTIRSVSETNSISNAAWDTITDWDATAACGQYDILNEFAASTGIWTVKYTGYYLIMATAHFDAANADTSDYLKMCGIFIGGAITAVGRQYGEFVHDVNVATIMYLATGQEVTVAAYQDSGAAIDITADLHTVRLS